MAIEATLRGFGAGIGAPRRMAWLWLIGIAFYLGAIFWIGWRDVAATAKSINLPWIALGMLAESIALWIRANKWRMALGTDRAAVTQFFLSKAAGGLTPGRVGELSPLLVKRFREPRTGAWIVLDRLMEASATLLFGFAGAIFLFGVSSGNALLVWFALVAIAVFVTLTLMMREDFAPRLRAFLGVDQRHGLPRTVLTFVCDAAEEVRMLGAKTPLLALITMLTTAMDIFVAFCLYASLGAQVPYLTLAAAQCAHAIVSVVPISANVTGIPYAVSAGILHEAANVPLDVLAAAIAVRFLMAGIVFWVSFAVGTRELFRRDRFTDQGALFDHLASRGVLYEYTPDSLDKLRSTIGSGGRTLDVGCGDGVIASAMDAQVIGLDISPKCAQGARLRGITVVVSDATRGLPFADASFDTIACVDVLHHLERNWDFICAELGRLLRPGGRLLIIEPDARNPFVRWTQAPNSPIRVAPWPDEPAIYPEALENPLRGLGFDVQLDQIHLQAEQTVRDVFPMWQRMLKAPFVIALASIYRRRPNKFLLLAQKPKHA